MNAHKPKKIGLAGTCLVAALLCGIAVAQAAAPPANPDDKAPGATAAPPTQAPAGPSPAEVAAQRAAAAAKAAVDVTDGWTRATPGTATTAAIYLRIVNAGKDPDRLIGADVGAAQKAELHTATTVNGVMKMDAVPAMAIPAGATVMLSPAGNHIMLVGLKAPLKEGESFLVKLNFEKAGSETAVVKILAANALGPPAPATGGNPHDVTSGVTPTPPAR